MLFCTLWKLPNRKFRIIDVLLPHEISRQCRSGASGSLTSEWRKIAILLIILHEIKRYKNETICICIMLILMIWKSTEWFKCCCHEHETRLCYYYMLAFDTNNPLIISMYITFRAQLNLVLRILNVNMFTFYINRCLKEFKYYGVEGKRMGEKYNDEIETRLLLTSHLHLM
jgi:hypothetical protein